MILCKRLYKFLNNNKIKKDVVSMKTLKQAKVGETSQGCQAQQARVQSRDVSWIWELLRVLRYLSARWHRLAIR